MYSALSGSTVDTCRLQFTRLLEEFHAFSSFWWTPGDDFMFVSVFSAELGSSADTCTASVYGAFCAQLQSSSWSSSSLSSRRGSSPWSL